MYVVCSRFGWSVEPVLHTTCASHHQLWWITCHISIRLVFTKRFWWVTCHIFIRLVFIKRFWWITCHISIRVVFTKRFWWVTCHIFIRLVFIEKLLCMQRPWFCERSSSTNDHVIHKTLWNELGYGCIVPTFNLHHCHLYHMDGSCWWECESL